MVAVKCPSPRLSPSPSSSSSPSPRSSPSPSPSSRSRTSPTLPTHIRESNSTRRSHHQLFLLIDKLGQFLAGSRELGMELVLLWVRMSIYGDIQTESDKTNGVGVGAVETGRIVMMSQ